MKIIVLNGSSKGEVSVTMQSVHFIKYRFPEHDLPIMPIAQQIKKFENNPQAFQALIEQIRAAEGVL